MASVGIHRIDLAAEANEAMRQAWNGLDKQQLASDLQDEGYTVTLRQMERWMAGISETETGQMSPLGRTDQTLAATQKQSRNRAIDLLAWLCIRFIRRDRNDAGPVQVIWHTRSLFTELEARVISLLAEEERQHAK